MGLPNTKPCLTQAGFCIVVGLPGSAPRSYPPQGYIILLYYSPVSRLGLKRYLFLPRDLMHLAQAEMRWPAKGRNFLLLISWGFLGTLNHCRLGYFLTLGAGLYLPLNLLYLPKSNEPFWHTAQVFAICLFGLMSGILRLLAQNDSKRYTLILQDFLNFANQNAILG